MSRTYRRKSGKVPWWVTEKHTYESGWIPLEGDEKKAAIKKYHSDAERTMHMVPADFRRFYNRLRKRSQRQEERRILKQADFEEYSFRPGRRDIRWLYW